MHNAAHTYEARPTYSQGPSGKSQQLSRHRRQHSSGPDCALSDCSTTFRTCQPGLQFEACTPPPQSSCSMHTQITSQLPCLPSTLVQLCSTTGLSGHDCHKQESAGSEAETWLQHACTQHNTSQARTLRKAPSASQASSPHTQDPASALTA